MLAGCLSLPSHHSSSSISLLFILKWNHPLYDLTDPTSVRKAPVSKCTLPSTSQEWVCGVCLSRQWDL